jgi:hypothetical protein
LSQAQLPPKFADIFRHNFAIRAVHPGSIWRIIVLTDIDYDSYEYAPSFRRAHVARHLWAHFITATTSTS